MIEASSNVEKVAGALKKAYDQVPFATARTVNRVGREVQQFEFGTQVPSKLTLRNQWATPGYKFGINLSGATKEDPTATVFSRAPWLDLQESGGDKKPKKSLLIAPVVGSAARPTNATPVVGRYKPTAGNDKIVYIPRLKGFFLKSKAPRRKKGMDDEPDFASLSTNAFKGGALVRLFSVFKRAFVKPRLEFRASGSQIARKVMEEHGEEYFTEAYREALKTAK